MRLLGITFSAVFCIALSYILDTQAQLVNRRRQPTKKPVTGGKWQPTRNKQPIRRRPNNGGAGNANRNQQNANQPGGNNQFDNLITPPLHRYEGEAPLQKISWTHCVNNIEVGNRWSSIMSPDYPENINGQLQCSWLVTGVPGMRLRISFNDLDLQEGTTGRCASQYVDVIDMSLLKSQGRFCGSDIPGDYVTVGHRLRIDIQGDTTVIPHKGFQAALRVEPSNVTPGMRQKSLMYHGETTTTRRTPARRPTPARKPGRTTTTAKTPSTKEGQVIYGPGNQPYGPPVIYGPNRQPHAPLGPPPTNKVASTTVVLYAFIGIFCLLVLLAGAAFIFRKSLYAKYKRYKSKHKTKKPSKKDKSAEDDDTISQKSNSDAGSESRGFSHGRFELPESNPVTPSLDGRRRRSVMFEDEVLAGMESDIPRNSSAASQRSGDTNDGHSQKKSDQSLSDYPHDEHALQFQGWDYPNGEPIYEDDTMSVQSLASVRSTSRHPDHSSYKQMKIMERYNAMLHNEEIYAPHSEPVYGSHVNRPTFQLGPPVMQQYNTMPMYGVTPHVTPHYDPRSHYVMGYPNTQQYNPYAPGQPMYPTYNQIQQHSPQNEQRLRSHDEPERAPITPETPGGMRPAKSLNDLLSAGNDKPPTFDPVRSSQSMAELPVETGFLKRQLERRQSFCM